MQNQQQLPTPQESLNVISSACRQLKLNLDEHIVIQNCLKVLQDVVEPRPQVEKVPKPESVAKETTLTE